MSNLFKIGDVVKFQLTNAASMTGTIVRVYPTNGTYYYDVQYGVAPDLHTIRFAESWLKPWTGGTRQSILEDRDQPVAGAIIADNGIMPQRGK